MSSPARNLTKAERVAFIDARLAQLYPSPRYPSTIATPLAY